ncbi:MAG: 50S ribosomal protein L24 [Bacilli bacterium]|nr:50S ribosomal protein L24 [Bacilli bacterium]
MKIKVGDNVKVLAGKDKGKEGKVIKTLKKIDKVVVEGINIVKKHSKPNNTNDKGGIFDIEAPIHVSNVKKIEETKKATKKETKKETASEEKATKKTTTKKASK